MSETPAAPERPAMRPPLELFVFVVSLLAAVALAAAPHRIGLF